MTAAEILVIFLSVALALLLLLAIILVIYLIVIARKIRRIAETAEKAVGSIEGITGAIRKAVTPAVVSQFVMETIAKFVRRRSDKKDKEG